MTGELVSSVPTGRSTPELVTPPPPQLPTVHKIATLAMPQRKYIPQPTTYTSYTSLYDFRKRNVTVISAVVDEWRRRRRDSRSVKRCKSRARYEGAVQCKQPARTPSLNSMYLYRNTEPVDIPDKWRDVVTRLCIEWIRRAVTFRTDGSRRSK